MLSVSGFFFYLFPSLSLSLFLLSLSFFISFSLHACLLFVGGRSVRARRRSMFWSACVCVTVCECVCVCASVCCGLFFFYSLCTPFQFSACARRDGWWDEHGCKQWEWDGDEWWHERYTNGFHTRGC